MEKMTIEQAAETKERFSWKERAGKVLRLSGLPVAFAMFLASCGGGKESGPSGETLNDLKERGEAVALSAESVSDLEAIIQKAKDDGKTHFMFEETGGNTTTIAIDTVENVIEMDHHVNLKTEKEDLSYGITDAFSIDDNGIKYNEYRGVNGSNSVVQLEADRASGLLTRAMVDKGTYDEGYGLNVKGEIVGDKEAGKEAVNYFSKTIRDIREKINTKQ